MNKTVAIIFAATGLLVVIAVAALYPLDTYTTKYGCREETVAVDRLSLILGDSIEKVKAADRQPAPNEGCARTIKYVLYAI